MLIMHPTKVNTVADATPSVGKTKIGEVDPANKPVPVCPDRLVFTALFVAMCIP